MAKLKTIEEEEDDTPRDGCFSRTRLSLRVAWPGTIIIIIVDRLSWYITWTVT